MKTFRTLSEPTAGAVTLQLDGLIATTGIGTDSGWAVIDPWTVQCELRAVNVSGKTLTWTGGLTYGHAVGDTVLFVTESVVNVKWFGAKGDDDGTGSGTDDSTAIQRAIDQLPAGSDAALDSGPGGTAELRRFCGGIVYFPQGTYKIATGLTIGPGTLLVGEGRQISILVYTGTGDAISSTDIAGLYAENDHGLRDLTLLSTGGAGADGCVFDTDDMGSLENVFITGFAGIGLHMKKCQFWHVKNLVVDNCGTGIKLDENADSLGCNNNEFVACRVWGGSLGIYYVRGQANWFHGLTCQYHSTYAVQVDANGIGLTISGAHFEYQRTVYDVYNAGTLTLLQNCFFVVDPVNDTERKIYNSGVSIIMTNCYTQRSDPATVRGSKAVITQKSDAGDITIIGGAYGAALDADDLAVDETDSAAGCKTRVSVFQKITTAIGMYLLNRLRIGVDAVASVVLDAEIWDDANPRLRVTGDGKLDWGDGTNTPDTNLYRSAADTLRTDDTLYGLTLRAILGASGDDAFLAGVTGDTLPRISITKGGIVRFSAGSGSYDTNLYRSAANVLATDDTFKIPVQTAAPASPANGMIVYADGATWNPGSGAGFYGYEAGAWVKL